MNKKKKTLIQTYKWTVVMIAIVGVLFFMNRDITNKITVSTIGNFKSMLEVLPPVLLLVGLLDVWIPKETLIKYMGNESGVMGIIIAILLGSLAAGPLYMAFPIAAILLKKQARLANVLFFLGVWSSTKLPLLIYEYSSFGDVFTFLHIIVNLTVFLIGSILIEKLISQDNLKKVYQTANEMVGV